jgi:MFS family permease
LCGSNCCSKLFAFSLFKNYKFKLLMLIGFLCIFGSALTITFIPPYAKDYNIPDDKIALLITISAICDFIGRFSVAWVADSGVIE